jgi:polyhydroxybutyrate depolymerase
VRGTRLIAGALAVLAVTGSGCDGLRPDRSHEVVAGALRRTYLLDLPPEPRRAGGTPAILAFHGGYGTPESFSARTRLSERAAAAGMAVAYPRGIGHSWNAGDCCGPAQRMGVDDVAFAAAVVADLERSAGVAPDRVYATGFSNGGKLVYRLACEGSPALAAVAVVAAAISTPPEECRPPRRPPVLHIHGAVDRFAPFDGGPSAQPNVPPQRSVRETLRVWHAEPGPCRSRAHVRLCVVEGMGHQWPGAPPLDPDLFGPGSEALSATDAIVGFFAGLDAERQPGTQ